MGAGVQELLEKYGLPNEAALIDFLQQRRRAHQEAAKDPEGLTEEERQLTTLGELYRFWKVRDQKRGINMKPLTEFDYADFGQLTKEIKDLPRRDIVKMISRLRQEHWITERMAAGVPLFKYKHCHRITADGHKCFATKWTTGKPGPLTERPVIDTQRPTGVAIQPAPGPSIGQLQEVQKASLASLEKHARLDRLLTRDVPMPDAFNTSSLQPSPPFKQSQVP